MKFSFSIANASAEQGVRDGHALANGMAEKSKAFAEQGAELYAKA